MKPICREPSGVEPCRFAPKCHRVRQELQDKNGLRGESCWFFVQIQSKLDEDVKRRAAGDRHVA